MKESSFPKLKHIQLKTFYNYSIISTLYPRLESIFWLAKTLLQEINLAMRKSIPVVRTVSLVLYRGNDVKKAVSVDQK